MKLKELIGVLPETEEVVLCLDGIRAEVEYDFFNVLTDEALDATVLEVSTSDDGKLAIWTKTAYSSEKETQDETESDDEDETGGELLCMSCRFKNKDPNDYPCCDCKEAYVLKYRPKEYDT